ncbi:LOW QUALITY PROTEIN: hypothetical protein PHMEG_00034827, partial [Phytophthora megakarya]
MEKSASGWFLHWSSTTRSEEHTWGSMCSSTSKRRATRLSCERSFSASSRQQTSRLKTATLIFRIEGMSVLDQMLGYTNGLKPRTRSYVKLKNPETLSDAMDFAVKYEVTHFIEDVRDRQPRGDKKKPFGDPAGNTGKAFKGNPSVVKVASNRELTRSNPKVVPVSFARSQAISKPNASLGRKPKGSRETSNHARERGSCRGRATAKFENISLDVLCENPLVYKARPLISVSGEITVGDLSLTTRNMLLDCRATTTYVSKRWVAEHETYTTKFSNKSIRVK